MKRGTRSRVHRPMGSPASDRRGPDGREGTPISAASGAKPGRRQRPRGPVPPPPVFPEPPRGFTVQRLHGRVQGQDNLVMLYRNIPQDWDVQAKRISTYAQAIRKAYQGRSPADEALGGYAWYPLHWAWQEHPDFGIEPFFHQVADEIEGRFPPVADPSIDIGVEAMPDGRRFEAPFLEPHILLALFPDGEYTRLLVREILGAVAVKAGLPFERERKLGPICFAVRGQVLDDGRPLGQVEGEPGASDIILMDPVVMVGDFGPVTRVQDGRFLYSDNPAPTKVYHPEDEPWFGLLRPEQQRYVKMWDGPVPGFVGRLGQFKKFLEQGRQQEQQQHAQVPTHAVYAQALENQIAILNFCRTNRPFERVARAVARDSGRTFDSDFARFTREEDDAVIGALETAHPVFWTADMLAVLEGLEPSLKVWEVRERDFLHNSGFVWFERPLRITAGDPEVMTGYVWFLRHYQGRQGYQVTFFTRYEGAPEDIPRDIWNASVSGNSPHHGAPRRPLFFPLGGTLASYLESVQDFLAGDNNQAVLSAIYSGTTVELDRAQLTRWARVFAASIVLMNQRLTRIADFRSDRSGRKRAQATLRIDREPPLIKTILLRRVDYLNRHPGEKGEGGTVNWSHRWLVSRHWREQWYPSENRHKSIVIEGYEKGPADKPLWVPKDGSLDLIGR